MFRQAPGANALKSLVFGGSIALAFKGINLIEDEGETGG